MAERHQTAKQVCLAKWQFSCWNKGIHQKPRTEKELATARKAWEAAKASGVNLYHDTSVNPGWASKVKFVKQIGRLMFYREA
jgi:spore germination cell wall hydrolase CwlJ-like protein